MAAAAPKCAGSLKRALPAMNRSLSAFRRCSASSAVGAESESVHANGVGRGDHFKCGTVRCPLQLSRMAALRRPRTIG